jgi:hypothetical protein
MARGETTMQSEFWEQIAYNAKSFVSRTEAITNKHYKRQSLLETMLLSHQTSVPHRHF